MTPTRAEVRALLRGCISGEETSLRQAHSLAQQMDTNEAIQHHSRRLAQYRAALAALDDADTLARMAKDAAAHSPSCRMGSTGDMCDTCDRLVNDLAVWHWSREGQS